MRIFCFFLLSLELFNTVSSLSQTYVKNLSPEINKLLETEESWGFDIIALERLTNKRPLVTLGLKILNRFRVCEYLKIEEVLLVNWLTLMESNYKFSNTYHNSTHAADVLHATAYFLSTNKISVSRFKRPQKIWGKKRSFMRFVLI